MVNLLYSNLARANVTALASEINHQYLDINILFLLTIPTDCQADGWWEWRNSSTRAGLTCVPKSFIRASASSLKLPCSTPELTRGMGISLKYRHMHSWPGLHDNHQPIAYHTTWKHSGDLNEDTWWEHATWHDLWSHKNDVNRWKVATLEIVNLQLKTK